MTMQETTTETKRKQVAEHALIDSGKNVVDQEESANGIRYTLLENGEVFDWLYDEATELERTLLAIFGAKTLATNETSQARNSKTGATADEQIAAVRDRFALIRGGQWVDRTREGVGGARVNRDQLAEAICQVLVDNKKKTQQEIDDGYKATVRQRLEDDAEWLAKMRKFPPVAAAYALIAGKDSGITVDSMMD
jgi:hypothetical protein